MVAIIVAVAVAVLVVVGVVVGVNVKAAADAEALREASAELLGPWQDKVDAVSTDASDRAELLSRYNELSSVRSGIEAARAAGELRLSDGSDCDLSGVTELIGKKQSAIREWFAADYESRLKSSALADGASADTTSRDAAQAAVDALTALRADLEAEKAVWGDPADSRYADLASRVDAQLVRANEVLAAIAAAEQAAAEAAAAEAAAAASANRYTCKYYTIDLSRLSGDVTISDVQGQSWTNYEGALMGYWVKVTVNGSKSDLFEVLVKTAGYGANGARKSAALPDFTDAGNSLHVLVAMDIPLQPFTLADGTQINEPQDLIDAGVVSMA